MTSLPVRHFQASAAGSRRVGHRIDVAQYHTPPCVWHADLTGFTAAVKLSAARCRAGPTVGIKIGGMDTLLDGLGDRKDHNGNRYHAEGNEPALFQFILGQTKALDLLIHIGSIEIKAGRAVDSEAEIKALARHREGVAA